MERAHWSQQGAASEGKALPAIPRRHFLAAVGATSAMCLASACSTSSSAPAPAKPPAGVAAGGPAATAAGGSPTPTAARTQTTVTVGLIGTVADGPIYIADERGYFRDAGVALEVVILDSAANMIPALASNQLAAGGGGLSAGLFNAIARGVDLRIVADRGSFPPGRRWSGIVVRKGLVDSGEVKTINDLKARNIAIPAMASSSEVVWARALAAGGLRLSDVNVSTLGLPDTGAGQWIHRRRDPDRAVSPGCPGEQQCGVAARYRRDHPRLPVLYALLQSQFRCWR